MPDPSTLREPQGRPGRGLDEGLACGVQGEPVEGDRRLAPRSVAIVPDDRVAL